MKRKAAHALSLLLGLCFLPFLPCAAFAGSQGVYDPGELFTYDDLIQIPDTAGAAVLRVEDGRELRVTEAGVYVLCGSARDAAVTVDAGPADEVRLVLDGLTLVSRGSPCLYVKGAGKVYISTITDSRLSVKGKFRADGDVKPNGAIFASSDLSLSGTAALSVESGANGIVSGNTLTVTGGSYEITAGSKALAARNSIRVSDGSFLLKAGTDGLHAEDDEDDGCGSIYLGGGEFRMEVGDDAIHAQTVAQIDGGSFDIRAAEGIEATWVQLNDGSLRIEASGDGINGAHKSKFRKPLIELNGGTLSVTAGEGDTDGIDCNGDLLITGGHIEVTAGSPFDVDGSVRFTGGTVIVNGRQVSKIPRG